MARDDHHPKDCCQRNARCAAGFQDNWRLFAGCCRRRWPDRRSNIQVAGCLGFRRCCPGKLLIGGPSGIIAARISGTFLGKRTQAHIRAGQGTICIADLALPHRV